MAPHISRRRVIAAVPVAALASAVAHIFSRGKVLASPLNSQSETISIAWKSLIASVVNMHPNAPAALRTAIDHGVDPQTFSGVALSGPREDHLPALFFGDRQLAYTMVMPEEVHEVRRFH